MVVKIQFIKDFATKKKNDIWGCDGILARTLINKKVAKKYIKGRPKK